MNNVCYYCRSGHSITGVTVLSSYLCNRITGVLLNLSFRYFMFQSRASGSPGKHGNFSGSCATGSPQTVTHVIDWFREISSKPQYGVFLFNGKPL